MKPLVKPMSIVIQTNVNRHSNQRESSFKPLTNKPFTKTRRSHESEHDDDDDDETIHHKTPKHVKK